MKQLSKISLVLPIKGEVLHGNPFASVVLSRTGMNWPNLVLEEHHFPRRRGLSERSWCAPLNTSMIELQFEVAGVCGTKIIRTKTPMIILEAAAGYSHLIQCINERMPSCKPPVSSLLTP
jgi:hypothetical protein